MTTYSLASFQRIINNRYFNSKLRRAAELFLGAVATFTSYELMDYEEFIRYVVIVSMVALPRHQLWSDILNGSEILEVLHTDQATKQYALSFYNSHFDKVCSIDNENS